MPKQRTQIQFLPFMLDDTSSVPIYLQLYNGLRQAILMGQLAAGTQLPSTRVLANQLGISRSTVLAAFDELLREGYVEGRQGSGTYVAPVLPEDVLYRAAPARTPRTPQTIQQSRSPSQRGKALADAAGPTLDYYRDQRAFRPGIPDLNQFPFDIWLRLAVHHWRSAPRNLLGYSHSVGYSPLRTEIAAYLKATRGVQCTAEQVIVTAGSQQAIDLTARVLLDPGEDVWMENPGYPGARSALIGAGAYLIPVAVDEEGLDVAFGIAQCPGARMVYVTPSYQFPLGTTMSPTRRLQLLEWAVGTRAWILEHDYDSEFRYAGRPLPALQALDTTGQVIYIGTFSKVLFPSLRLGYLIAPPDLVDTFAAARSVTDWHSPILDQLVLTDFITQGHFARHIRQMRGMYAERQAHLIDAAKRELSGLLTVRPAVSGMHLVATLTDEMDDQTASKRAAAYQLVTPPLSLYSIGPCHHNALLLGYTAMNKQEINEGVRRLATALSKV